MPDRDFLSLNAFVPVATEDVALVTSETAFERHNVPDSAHRLLFVQEGTLHVEFNQISYVLNPGQTLLIKSGNAFIRRNLTDAPLRYYAIRFTINDLEPLEECKADVSVMTTLGRPDRVEQLFKMLLDDQSDGLLPLRSTQMLSVQILSEVADGERLAGQTNKCCVPLVERAKAHIRAHYDRPISTSTVAESVECSPGYLSRAFRTATNSTVTDFIHEVRLFRACQLLAETNRSVAQISRECGFDNPGYFHRLFRRREGTSPVNYRKLHSRIYMVTIK